MSELTINDIFDIRFTSYPGPDDVTLKTGPHAGKTVRHVSDEAPGYLPSLPLAEEARVFLSAVAEHDHY